MREAKVASIWIGTFESESDFDWYFSETFQSDVGFDIYWPAGPEGGYKHNIADIRTLLERASLSNRFIDEAVEKSTAKNITSANSSLVFLHLAYDESQMEKSMPMTFLGPIRFTEG